MQRPFEYFDEIFSQDLRIDSVVLHHPEGHVGEVLLVGVRCAVDFIGEVGLFVYLRLQTVVEDLKLL